MKKTIAFELPAIDEIEIEIDYTYSFTPGKYYGPFEDSYPDDEDSDIEIVKGYEATIMAVYLKLAKEAIKSVEDQVQKMLDDGMPRQWADGDCEEDYGDYEREAAGCNYLISR